MVAVTPIASAVLVPLFRDRDDELRLVLVVRGEAGVHGGRLGLPGGKRKPGDVSLLETPLRETEEEIGLGRSEITVVAELAPIDTRTTGFRVQPYLARIRPPDQWRLAPGEVTAVVTQRAWGAQNSVRFRDLADLQRDRICAPHTWGLVDVHKLGRQLE